MATFRAIHPFVREQAFKLGFEPVIGQDYRVEHPRLSGKRAQAAFYKAFAAASGMPGVRRVSMPGSPTGTTLLFPQVPESRWEAARRGVTWISNPTPYQTTGTIGELIREKLGKKPLVQSVDPDYEYKPLNTFRRPYSGANAPTGTDTASSAVTITRARSVQFNGSVDDTGCLVNFNVSTSDDSTARTLLEALALNKR